MKSPALRTVSENFCRFLGRPNSDLMPRESHPFLRSCHSPLRASSTDQGCAGSGALTSKARSLFLGGL